MTKRKIRFGIIGVDHNHVYLHTKLLLEANAEFAGYYTTDPGQPLVKEFADTYPHARRVETMEELLEDPTIDVIGGAAMPAERAGISVRAMQHGKDVLADKPAVISLEQLDEIERVQRETGRIWCLYVNEHHTRRCTVRGAQLAAAGAIGRVVNTTGIGPHHIRKPTRPAWFFDRAISGGVIGDIGTHQIEQFLHFTNSTSAGILYARTGNFGNPDVPLFEDYGEVSLVGDGGTGWFRVDWYTPAKLGVAGDIRLFVVGTEGHMEMRKYIDTLGRPGAEHLFLINRDGARYIDVSDVPLTFGERFLDDVRNRTATAMNQKRSFLSVRLATQAQLMAQRMGFEAPQQGGCAASPVG